DSPPDESNTSGGRPRCPGLSRTISAAIGRSRFRHPPIDRWAALHVQRRMSMRRAVALMAATGAVLAGLVGCSSTSGAGTTSASNPDVKKAEAALASMSSGAVLSKGPHGETAQPASSAALTPDEIA